MKRIITGLLLGAAVVYLVLRGHPYLMAGVCLVISLAGLWEFFRLSEAAGVRPHRSVGYLVSVAWMLVSITSAKIARSGFVLPTDVSALWILALLDLFVVLWLTITLLPGWHQRRLLHSSRFATFLGTTYVTIPLCLLVWVWMQYDGAFTVLFALVVIWAGDTAGFFIGKNFGKHKSSPRISPNKTWEGTIASFVGALLVGLITALYFWGGEGVSGYAEPLLLAAALNVAGQFGDLAESALKRSAGVKDSSNLIPGHGGVLDRIDALLFAAPVLWYYWLWKVPGISVTQ
jgi:phosphatidate cytidylyltransferase